MCIYIVMIRATRDLIKTAFAAFIGKMEDQYKIKVFLLLRLTRTLGQMQSIQNKKTIKALQTRKHKKK